MREKCNNRGVRKKTLRILSEILSSNIVEPLVLVLIYAGFLYFIQGVMPSSERLVSHLESLYGRYGYEILFLSACAESLVVVNVFAPGMVALAFGGVFARTGHLNLTGAILAAVAGAIIGFVIDYFLGYFGFSKIVEKIAGIDALGSVKKRVDKTDIKIFSLGYFHPNLGSVISLAAGTVEMKFINFVFLSFVSTLAWFSLWGLVVYSTGDLVLNILNKYLSVIGLLFSSVWFLMFLYGRRKSKRQKKD